MLTILVIICVFLCFHFSEPYEPKPVLGATLAAVRGYSAPMDLVRVETKNDVSTNLALSVWTISAIINHFYRIPTVLDNVFIPIDWLGSNL